VLGASWQKRNVCAQGFSVFCSRALWSVTYNTVSPHSFCSHAEKDVCWACCASLFHHDSPSVHKGFPVGRLYFVWRFTNRKAFPSVTEVFKKSACPSARKQLCGCSYDLQAQGVHNGVYVGPTGNKLF